MKTKIENIDIAKDWQDIVVFTAAKIVHMFIFCTKKASKTKWMQRMAPEINQD